MNAATDTERAQRVRQAPVRMSVRYRIVRKIGYFFRLQLQTEPGLLWRLAMAALVWIMRLYCWTLRYSVEDKSGYLSDRLERPVIFLLWHNRIANMPLLYERRCRRHGRSACVLTSTTPEGALLALFLGHFGLGSVRVANSPRAPNAMRELAGRMEKRQDLFVTPDGPLGPRYHLKPGALWFAQSTGRPIVPLHIESSGYVRFKSWDGFALALPFARVKVVLDEPVWISASCTNDEFEAERARIEQIMIDGLVMDRAVAAG